MNRQNVPSLVLATVLVALSAACSKATPTAAPAAGAPVAVATTAAATAVPTTVVAVPVAAEGLSGEDFVAKAASLAGSTVTLGKCSLMKTPISSGDYPCRVVGADGSDVKTPDGLPVDVFLVGASLDAAAKDFIATSCPDTFCNVQLTGTLAVSEATFYLTMTDVKLAPAP